MNEHDELRARLARLDPAPPSLPVDLPTSPRAHQLRERAMLTTTPTSDTPTPPAWRRPAVLAAAAAAVVALGAGGLLAQGDDAPAGKKPVSTLALKGPASSGGGTSMSSCVAFDVAILRDMPLAFGGTVTSVTGDSVTLDVDRWYKGGDADVVTVSTPGQNVSIDGVEFVQGTRYLVTATEGTVNTCGFSGEATPDLTKAFDEAFAP